MWGWGSASPMLPFPGRLGLNTCAWSSAFPRKQTVIRLGTQETKSLLTASLGNLRPQCPDPCRMFNRDLWGQRRNVRISWSPPQPLPCCHLQPQNEQHTHTHRHTHSFSLSLTRNTHLPHQPGPCHGLCQPQGALLQSLRLLLRPRGKGLGVGLLRATPPARPLSRDLALWGSVHFLTLGFRPKQLC